MFRVLFLSVFAYCVLYGLCYGTSELISSFLADSILVFLSVVSAVDFLSLLPLLIFSSLRVCGTGTDSEQAENREKNDDDILDGIVSVEILSQTEETKCAAEPSGVSIDSHTADDAKPQKLTGNVKNADIARLLSNIENKLAKIREYREAHPSFRFDPQEDRYYSLTCKMEQAYAETEKVERKGESLTEEEKNIREVVRKTLPRIISELDKIYKDMRDRVAENLYTGISVEADVFCGGSMDIMADGGDGPASIADSGESKGVDTNNSPVPQRCKRIKRDRITTATATIIMEGDIRKCMDEMEDNRILSCFSNILLIGNKIADFVRGLGDNPDPDVYDLACSYLGYLLPVRNLAISYIKRIHEQENGVKHEDIFPFTDAECDDNLVESIGEIATIMAKGYQDVTNRTKKNIY